MIRPTRAEVSLEAVRSNLKTYRSLLGPQVQLMAVVKSDGYGHGDLEVARAALSAGASRLGVALVEEGERIREAGIDAPIHLLFEPPPDAAIRVVELGLTPTVYTDDYAHALDRAASGARRSIPVHVKLDTGMHRVGIDPPRAVEVLSRWRKLRHLEIEGIYTHLATAATLPADDFSRAQLDRFLGCLEELEGAGFSFSLRHAAASGAAISLPESRLDMVRLGISMYGLYPGEGFRDAVHLRPALSLKTELCHVFRAGGGEGVSYGLTWRLPGDGWVGVIPLGYGDGLMRRLSNRMEVLVGGKRYRQVGTICMDMTMVYLGEDRQEPGEEVVIIGSQGNESISVEDLAKQAETINYEVVCALGKRIPRVYV